MPEAAAAWIVSRSTSAASCASYRNDALPRRLSCGSAPAMIFSCEASDDAIFLMAGSQLLPAHCSIQNTNQSYEILLQRN